MVRTKSIIIPLLLLQEAEILYKNVKQCFPAINPIATGIVIHTDVYTLSVVNIENSCKLVLA